MRSDCFLRYFARRGALAAVVCGLVFCGGAVAQEAAPAQPAEPAAAVADLFAPGVLTTIPAEVDRADAMSVHDVVELRADASIAWEPSSTTKSRTLYDMARQAAFVQDVWCLELSFKPLRMIEVDVPQPSGRLQRKLVWYMVYRVRNTGVGLSAEVQPDGEYVTTAKGAEAVRFIPEFVLSSNDRASGDRVRKAYLDRIVPSALEAIRVREMPEGVPLHHSAQMPLAELRIEAGRAQQGLWGVAMWIDVDPQIDFFSVYVRGLSNALQWTDPAEGVKPNDPLGAGRRFTHKTLQLNFWRPGDELDQQEEEIRFGVAPGRGAFYDSPEGVAYRWVYR